MREEFLREHEFNEDVVPQEEPGIFLNVKEDKLKKFQALLEARLGHTSNETEIVQSVVMAALETEGLEVRKPEIIVQAVLANPDIKRSALLFAEDIMRKNIQ